MGDPTCPKLPFTVKGRYVARDKLGAGCFACVCRGEDSVDKRKIAVKFEDRSNRAPQLDQEYKILQKITANCGGNHPQGFVEVYYYGSEKNYWCLCMELLGPTLEDKLQACGGKFTPRSALVIAEQVLRRLEWLHSKGFVHSDIKPENFAFGPERGDKRHHLYLIDFGLSKQWYTSRDGHVKEAKRNHLTGTARYASINAHKGIEQSRRDDLEAVGHMFMYFLRGSLPWSGIAAKTRDEKYRKIMQKKEQVPLKDLCEGHPPAFQKFLDICRGFQYKALPDYERLRGLFLENGNDYGDPDEFALEWLDKERPLPATLKRMEEWKPPRQPDEAGARASGFSALSGADFAMPSRPESGSCSCCSCFWFLR